MNETEIFTTVNTEFNKIQKDISNDFKLLYSEYQNSSQKLANALKLLEASKKEYRELSDEHEKNLKYIQDCNRYIKQLTNEMNELKDVNSQLEEENSYYDYELKRKKVKIDETENELDENFDPVVVEENVLQKEDNKQKRNKKRIGISKAS